MALISTLPAHADVDDESLDRGRRHRSNIISLDLPITFDGRVEQTQDGKAQLHWKLTNKSELTIWMPQRNGLLVSGLPSEADEFGGGHMLSLPQQYVGPPATAYLWWRPIMHDFGVVEWSEPVTYFRAIAPGEALSGVLPMLPYPPRIPSISDDPIEWEDPEEAGSEEPADADAGTNEDKADNPEAAPTDDGRYESIFDDDIELREDKLFRQPFQVEAGNTIFETRMVDAKAVEIDAINSIVLAVELSLINPATLQIPEANNKTLQLLHRAYQAASQNRKITWRPAIHRFAVLKLEQPIKLPWPVTIYVEPDLTKPDLTKSGKKPADVPGPPDGPPSLDDRIMSPQ